jgi:hypothetical protein
MLDPKTFFVYSETGRANKEVVDGTSCTAENRIDHIGAPAGANGGME